MSEQLSSGSKTTLRQPEIKIIGLDFFWDRKSEYEEIPINIDFGIMALEEDKTFNYLVNYAKSSFGGIEHFGDCSDSSDEKFIIDLEHLPSNVSRLMVIMVVSFAEKRNHSLNMIGNLEMKLTDLVSNTELFTWKKDNFKDMEDFSGMYVCEVYLYKGQWKIHIIDKAVSSKTFGQLTRSFRL